MLSTLHSIISPESLISSFGIIGVIAIVFIETGFFFGFFFPGDSLLFTAGLRVSAGPISVTDDPIWWLGIEAGGTIIAAETGDSRGCGF